LKNTTINKNEINLRELFSTIGRYKWSIIFFTITLTLAVAVKVYFMPKYYKSTVTLEVKSEEKSGGFSMSGAAAMLLGGSGGGSANLDKDMTLFKMYRVNSKALEQVKGYMVRYFIKNEKYQEVEVDSNLSIKVTDVKINNFKDYGLRLKVTPINTKEYSLFHGDDVLGTFHYDEMVKNEDVQTKLFETSMLFTIVADYVEELLDMSEDLLEIQPTLLISVPRIFERVYGKISAKLERDSPIKRKLFNMAVAVLSLASSLVQRLKAS